MQRPSAWQVAFKVRAAWVLLPISAVQHTIVRRSGASAPSHRPQEAVEPRPSGRLGHHCRHGRIGVNNTVHRYGLGGTGVVQAVGTFGWARTMSLTVALALDGRQTPPKGRIGHQRAYCEQFIHTYACGGYRVPPGAFVSLTMLYKTLILPQKGPVGLLLRWRICAPSRVRPS